MPEGDTIHRTAASLRRALVGRSLIRVELPRVPRPHPQPGATIDRIEARGKHLLVFTSEGLVVHTHLRMTGSWHLYRPGQRWSKATSLVRVVLGTDEVVAVCFSAPVVAVLDERGLARHRTLRALGPDLCDPKADLEEAEARLERFSDPARPIGEALLDQRVACGVGNVYRSEALFLAGVAPATPVGAVEPHQRQGLLATSAKLLRDNLDSPARTTVTGGPDGSLWVYGRAGAACRRCGDTIERLRLGEQARSVYRCPTCQPDRS